MIRGLALVALAALLAGCAELLRDASPPQTYTLETPSLPPANAGEEVLRVRLTGVSAGYERPLMAYRAGDALALDYFATARWVTPPAELVTEQLAAALEATGRFRAVLTGAPPPVADYRLELELLRLEQDYRNGEPGVARLEVRARLLDRDGALVGQRRLAAEAAAEASGPAGAAAAANHALADIAASLDTDLNRWLAGAEGDAARPQGGGAQGAQALAKRDAAAGWR